MYKNAVIGNKTANNCIFIAIYLDIPFIFATFALVFIETLIFLII